MGRRKYCCFCDCKNELGGSGNKSKPIMKGLCCDVCHVARVLPYRIAMMEKGQVFVESDFTMETIDNYGGCLEEEVKLECTKYLQVDKLALKNKIFDLESQLKILEEKIGVDKAVIAIENSVLKDKCDKLERQLHTSLKDVKEWSDSWDMRDVMMDEIKLDNKKLKRKYKSYTTRIENMVEKRYKKAIDDLDMIDVENSKKLKGQYLIVKEKEQKKVVRKRGKPKKKLKPTRKFKQIDI